MLERREHRGHLLDLAAKAHQRRLDPSGVKLANRFFGHHPAGGVQGVGFHAKTHDCQVFLVGVEQEGNDLGGLAHAHRQHA